MTIPFAAAMGRALDQTRAGNPADATRTIQSLLAGKTSEPAALAHSARPIWSPKDPAVPDSDRPRQPLGSVIDRLARGRRQKVSLENAFASRPTAHPPVPAGARYLARRHVTAFGNRDYRLFLPSRLDLGPQGIVLMLHGCTQNADDFAVGTRMNLHAERNNLIAIYPQQDRSANQMACWNWFRPDDQHRDRGEPALLADLARSIAAEFPVAPDRIFAAGLSAGGAMAIILGKVHPDVFAAVGVHSGLAPGSATDVASAYATMNGQGSRRSDEAGSRVRAIIFHGTADTVVHPANADRVLSAALAGASTIAVEDTSVSRTMNARRATCLVHRDPAGRTLAETWTLDGAGHAWSGGAPEGSYTDASGPDATAEAIRFFLNATEDRT